MAFIQRFKSGLHYGLNSFGLLWKKPLLLVYLSAPILLGITLELIIYNLFFFSDRNTALFVDGIMMHIWSTCGWIQHIGMFLTDTIRLFVTIFASAALMHHINHLMKGEPTTLKHCLRKTFAKTQQIFAWSLIATIFFVLIHPIDQIVTAKTCSSCFKLAFFVSAFARITWSLLTAFVVVIISLEHLPLRQIIKTAPDVTKKMILEYVGALCWIGLIVILGVTPLLLLHLTSPTGQTLAYTIITIGGCILSTVYAILLVTLYRDARNASLWDKIITFPPL